MTEKTIFLCSECGHAEPKWLGRCPDCGNWNTLFESTQQKKSQKSNTPQHTMKTIPLNIVESTQALRISSGLTELDRVLGGGIMKSATVLVGGEPGIGKSTLMLMAASRLSTMGKVLYISGEESPEQIKLRAQRINALADHIELCIETDVESIIHILNKLKPVMVIVDSIQTLKKQELGLVAGTVNQIKFTAQELIDWTKQHNTSLFMVGHVTKEGTIAGPKVIEHMVDTVLQFESADNDIRLLRASKNRFGSIDEIGIFQMLENGLVQPDDSESLFLEKRNGVLPAGVVVAPVYEGSRVILLEIQSLVVPAKGGISRVYSDRIDARVVWKAQAVLEKHCSLQFGSYDMYVNVAGGLSIKEVGIELPLCLALFSARTGIPFPSHTTVTGEVSLAGEIRNVKHLEKRVKTAAELGFSKMIGPFQASMGNNKNYLGVSLIQEAVRGVFTNAD
ncbi:MAG: DNA repair protein RadA [Spirochaetales bacterium]|nr:DNA repair protein RadA [Spirochaetales bacterium]